MNIIKRWIKENSKWMILILCTVFFFFLLENVFHNEIFSFDSIVYQSISFFQNDFLTTILKFITQLGGAVIVISISILSLVIAKGKKIGIAVGINLITIFALNNLLKNIIQRPRPTQFRLIDETGYSFPSGHSMVSMAFYGFLIYLIYKKVKNRYIKWGSCILLSLLIIGIGISRIYLGVHYASDVLAGFCISIAYLILFTHIFFPDLSNKKEKNKS